MTLLPIVERELRVASRRPSLYRMRGLAALVAVGLCAWTIGLSSQRSAHEVGLVTFGVLSVMAFVYALVAGVQSSCDCLSEEKREGTLGLLFLTDLKAHDIVFGKLAANSVNTFYGLLAVLPVLAIPLLLGGVTAIEFWRVALVTLNLLFLFVSLGMFASALCRKEQKALALSAVIALFLVGGIPLVIAIKEFNSNSQHDAWFAAGPAAACATAFAQVYGPVTKTVFWSSVIITHIYGWLFLMAACLLVPRALVERNANAAKTTDRWLGYTSARKLAVRRALLDLNPFLWRCSRPENKNFLVWLALAALVGGWIWFAHMVRADLFIDDGTDVAFLFSLSFLLKFWIALEACQAFAEDRRSGGFELLLSTPLPEKAFIRGQDRALLRQFGGPVAVVFLGNLLMLSGEMGNRNYSPPWEAFTLHALLAASLVLDALALGRWSMWLGLSGRKPVRAALQSLAAIIVLPTLLFLPIQAILGNALQPAASRWLPPLLWFCMGLATDYFFWSRAATNLERHFRACATNTLLPRRAKSAAP
jgi:ABC-type transport system involved in cytochrome c biogenesis permease component